MDREAFVRVPTQIDAARAGRTTTELASVAESERLEAPVLREAVAAGRVVIPANRHHAGLAPVGIGRALRTKVNANIGNSALTSGLPDELEKLRVALQYGADTVMDLSTGPEAPAIRRRILAACPCPVGTVPIYQAVAEIDDPVDLTADGLLRVIEAQAREGVDYMTLHAGLLRAHVPLAQRRLLGIVSRGGALLAHWMGRHGIENPLYERFDDVLAICREHEVTLSLGDGLRPGCLADASDEAQFAELDALGGLVRRARAAGVQVMVEGPGHVPLDQIAENMRREREACDDAPFYVLGPVVADCAPGYDHITASIGGAWAAFHGAAMLCYVTPSEHLGLPDANDVREGVVAFKLAAHAADVALHRPGARDRDDAISRARVAFDWETQFSLALDPARAREIRARSLKAAGQPDNPASDPADTHYCTMCGPKFCPMRLRTTESHE